MRYSRHGPGLDLTKGRLFLKGLSFEGRPKDGISIAVWLKLSSIDGSHVIFSSTSSKKLLTKVSYLFKIQDGRFHWSYENDIGENVFTVLSPLLISPNIWCHVVVIYDSLSEKAKIIVNGKVKGVGNGRGTLSTQLGDQSYLGSNSDGNAFNGYLDEVYIFKRPLRHSEVRQYLINMDSSNYALNNVSKVKLLKEEKDFPTAITSERLKNVQNSAGKSIVKIKVSDHPKNSSGSMNIKIIENSNSTHNNTSQKFRGNSGDAKFKGLFSELKAASFPNVADYLCAVNGTVYEKWTFSGGLKSGKFVKIADISNITSCINECCERSSCDAAIMKGTTCFALKCHSQKLCELRPAKLSTFDLKIAFVKRTPKKVIDQSDERISLPSDKCVAGIRVANVTINAGVGAGEVVQYRNITTIDQCVSQCCSTTKCNTAFLVQSTCYVIGCVIKDFCKVRPPPSADFLSEVVYVNRSGKMLFDDPQQALMLAPKSNAYQGYKPLSDTVKNTTYTAKLKLKQSENDTMVHKEATKEHKSGTMKHIGAHKKNDRKNLTKTYTTETECRVETIKTDVRLAGDLSAGEFVDHGVVRGIKSCIIKCCSDPLCNVTYMIGKKCFAVRCHSAELCQTIPSLPKALSPTVAFLRRKKLKGNANVLIDVWLLIRG